MLFFYWLFITNKTSLGGKNEKRYIFMHTHSYINRNSMHNCGNIFHKKSVSNGFS